MAEEKKKKKSLTPMNGYDELHMELIKISNKLDKKKKEVKVLEKKLNDRGYSIDSLLDQNTKMQKKIEQLEKENRKLMDKIRELKVTINNIYSADTIDNSIINREETSDTTQIYNTDERVVPAADI